MAGQPRIVNPIRGLRHRGIRFTSMSQSRLQRDEWPCDGDLVEVCNRGDANERNLALGVIYKRHRAELLQVARRYSPDLDTAQDVVQNTFEYLLRKFPPEGEGVHLEAKLSTLLHTVAMHNALSAVRQARRWAACEINPDDLPGRAPPEPNVVAALLSILPAAQRETLRLRVVEGHTLREIGNILHVPVGTVKSRLNTAVRRLRHSRRAQQLLHH